MFRIPIGRLTGDSEKLSRQTDGTVGGFSVFFNGFEDLGGAKFSEGAKFSFPPPPLFVVPRGDVNRKQNFAHPYYLFAVNRELCEMRKCSLNFT